MVIIGSSFRAFMQLRMQIPSPKTEEKRRTKVDLTDHRLSSYVVVKATHSPRWGLGFECLKKYSHSYILSLELSEYVILYTYIFYSLAKLNIKKWILLNHEFVTLYNPFFFRRKITL